MKVAVLFALTLTPGLLVEIALQRGKTTSYTAPEYGIAFDYPAQWRTAACRAAEFPAPCVILYRQPRDLDNDRFMAKVRFVRTPLEQTADAEGFTKRAGRWYSRGRFQETEVEEISGSGWPGLLAIDECSIYPVPGQPANSGECMTAIRSNGDRSVVIYTDGFGPPGPELEALMESIRFVKPPGDRDMP